MPQRFDPVYKDRPWTLSFSKIVPRTYPTVLSTSTTTCWTSPLTELLLCFLTCRSGLTSGECLPDTHAYLDTRNAFGLLHSRTAYYSGIPLDLIDQNRSCKGPGIMHSLVRRFSIVISYTLSVALVGQPITLWARLHASRLQRKTKPTPLIATSTTPPIEEITPLHDFQYETVEPIKYRPRDKASCCHGYAIKVPY